ncbi:probable beta-1,3-galactosyltransferase 8 isoform X1 [Oryza brachyantha]|uniref:probable beta-1,3-galactosyltransferase 8 isoform X1 n=3 Tax=Oryza brachyantha TaxID=4533 RepID=UPI00077601F0|nr:probable beta-1,3-galactosyltransferase 8 isoform X1 [Oryza brachyantha]XP_015693028.1 probable beta-1,3-galactosyltransferase 8 isoform X1 [Oryza brachyantha]
MSFPLLTRSALLTEPPRRGAIDSRRLRHRSKRSVSPTFPLWLSPPSIYPVFHSISVGSSLARNALTERQPQSEKKAARARPMSAKAVVVLCATSFFVGMLLSGRMTLLVPPTGGDGEVSSGHGSRLSLFSDDCEHRRKLDEGNPNDIMNEVSRTHQAIQSLDKSVSSLEMELAVERAKQNGGLGAAVPSKGRLPKALVVVGINTAFSSKKRRDSLRDTWVPRGDGLRRLEEEKGVVVRFVIGHSATPGGALDRAIDVEDAETRDFMRLDHVEGYHELSSKTRTYFTAAVATWDADFYVKVDDDVHVNLGMLASRLARYRTRPRVYVGCMKSGPVLSQKGVKYHEPEYWKFGDEGNRYFRHATGQIYAISKDLASYISINQPILHRFANEDVSLGAWMIGLEVEHVDDRSLCCATPPDCEWKKQAGNVCAASFDWSCSGICKSVDRMRAIHSACGEGDAAVSTFSAAAAAAA